MATPREPELTREQIAHREIGHTAVTAGVARALVATFLLLVLAIAAFEIARAAAGDESARAPWGRLAAIPEGVRSADDLWTRNRAVIEGLHGFENALEDESRIGRLLRPPMQLALVSAGGAGNEQAYIGRDGWLFYRPDVEYATGRGFLDPDVMKRRARATAEWATPPQPDPARAILAFKGSLEARGIVLIVVPTPVKPTVQADMLTGNAGTAPLVPRNPDEEPLLKRLRAAGVTVIDPAPALVRARVGGASQYLATDTHWRPEAMESVAGQVAAEVRRHIAASVATPRPYRTQAVDVAALGDVFAMLDLPPDQGAFQPETVTVRRVLTADGLPWRSSADADVLLLGDSFTNIYSLESMGWGTSGGFAEQLSLAVGRPIDRIVQNDAGAYATREMLMRAGPGRLAGKKVVVWQFAAREFASGDWKVLQ